MCQKLRLFMGAFAAILATTSAAARADLSQGCTVAGPDTATITIEEYVDFECSFCLRGSNTMKEIVKNFPGKVRVVLRNLPLPLHTNAVAAAKAFEAVCLQDPSLAADYQEQLFANQDRFISQGEPYLYLLAEQLGVDTDQMKSDMAGDEVRKALAHDQQLADSQGFKGTPSFVIGKQPITGAYPYEDFKKVIEMQLGQ